MLAAGRPSQDSAAQRLATGRVVLIALGLLLVVALAALDTERGKRRAELEEFILEPIAPAAANIPQMALAQAYRGSMLWYFSVASIVHVFLSPYHWKNKLDVFLLFPTVILSYLIFLRGV